MMVQQIVVVSYVILLRGQIQGLKFFIKQMEDFQMHVIMAYNMQVAFATTVIGLFAGGIGFVVKAVKQRWYRRDMGALNYIADMLDENRSK